MSYRDDLAAAQAKIRQLEQQLDAFQATGDDAQRKCATLAADNHELEKQLAELKLRYSVVQRKLEALRGATAPASVDTVPLHDHNRRLPLPDFIGTVSRAGVTCPMCPASDDSAEMVVWGPSILMPGDGGKCQGVLCLRCAYTGQMRLPS